MANLKWKCYVWPEDLLNDYVPQKGPEDLPSAKNIKNVVERGAPALKCSVMLLLHTPEIMVSKAVMGLGSLIAMGMVGPQNNIE